MLKFNLSWTKPLILAGVVFCFSSAMLNIANSTIIGVDDRTVISIDDKRAVEFSLRTPRVQYCGNRKTTGILTRIKGDNADYLLLSAQHLFNGIGHFNRYDSNKDGSITKEDERCTIEDLNNAIVAFNLVLVGTKYHEFGRTVERGIFDGAPINLQDASNFLATGEDVLIVKLKKKISEQIIPHTNKKRGYSKFLPVGNYIAQKLDQKSANIAFHLDTAHQAMKSEGCKIRSFNVDDDPRISFKSKCDAQPGSSNSPIFVEHENQAAIWGLVVGGAGFYQREDAPVQNWISVKSTELLVKEYGLETIKLDAIE